MSNFKVGQRVYFLAGCGPKVAIIMAFEDEDLEGCCYLDCDMGGWETPYSLEGLFATKAELLEHIKKQLEELE